MDTKRRASGKRNKALQVLVGGTAVSLATGGIGIAPAVAEDAPGQTITIDVEGAREDVAVGGDEMGGRGDDRRDGDGYDAHGAQRNKRSAGKSAKSSGKDSMGDSHFNSPGNSEKNSRYDSAGNSSGVKSNGDSAKDSGKDSIGDSGFNSPGDSAKDSKYDSGGDSVHASHGDSGKNSGADSIGDSGFNSPGNSENDSKYDSGGNNSSCKDSIGDTVHDTDTSRRHA